MEPGQRQYDAFISYAHSDAAWVGALADNLQRLGLQVFLDQYEITAGDVLVPKLEAGIATTRCGVLVLSRESVKRPWVQEEYAALLTRAVERKLRLIPVLREDLELPPFIASRVWVDFRGVDGDAYAARVRELANHLTSTAKRARPEAGEPLQPAPGSALRPEGAIELSLHIARDEVVLRDAHGEVRARQRPAGFGVDAESRLWELERTRRRQPDAIEHATRAQGESSVGALHARLLDAGSMLGDAFLAGEVGTALSAELARADRFNAQLRLGLRLQNELQGLPWETLCLPAPDGASAAQREPLALHRCVELYRRFELGVAPALSIPGPLRILVAIGSPEAQTESGELLDVERELGRILDGTQPARHSGSAYVRILRRASCKALRAALETQRFHVLHVSCHAGAAGLVLEDDAGQQEVVNAARFASEVLPPGRGVPLIVLSGCSTAKPSQGQTLEGSTGEHLPSVAAGLLERGVPAVVAMTAPVTDRYAIRWARLFYRELASAGGQTEVLRVVSQVRRALEQLRREEPNTSAAAKLAEWATPTLLLRGPALPLFDPALPAEKLQLPNEPQLEGMVVRRVGDFVGRRRDGRLALAALCGDVPGVLLHGLGGVGKSSLSAQLAADLAEHNFLVVSASGELAVDDVLGTIAERLFSLTLGAGLDERHPMRQVASALQVPKLPWAQRLGLLRDHVTNRQPLLLLLDNFEDNLGPGDPRSVKSEELAAFLTALIERPTQCRLLFTCRYPFALPGAAERALLVRHLGPLSLAETRQLIWRLRAVNALSPADKERAYREIGGHPRTLEYLDALLRGGEARFDDVRARIERALRARGIADPTAWLSSQAGGMDPALAEAVTLAADDVLLDELLAQVASEPLAAELAQAAAVYRVPVDEAGLRFVVSEAQALPESVVVEWRAVAEEIAALRETDGKRPDFESLPEPLQVRYLAARREQTRPPLAAEPAFAPALSRLLRLGLIAPKDHAGGPECYAMHRWTADHLVAKATSNAVRTAHERAARYFRWRVAVWPQSRAHDITELIEARHHFHRAGLLEEALSADEIVVEQLYTWGAYARCEQLQREVLHWVPARSRGVGVAEHQLGRIAEQRGDYDGALQHYRTSLEIREELGDRAGMANSYGALGNVACKRGAYDGALQLYRKCLEISEELGDRAGMAGVYHQLGMIAGWRGDDDELQLYRRSLEIEEELGNRTGMAASYHQLGIVAQYQGDYDGALLHYRKSLEIKEELGDRAGMANSYHQLGRIAELREDYDGAMQQYRRSLEIEEELGNRAGIATSYHQLGVIAQARGDYDWALEQYRRSLEIDEELGNRAGIARSYGQIGKLHTERGQPEDGMRWNLESLAIHLQLRSRNAGLNLNLLRRQRDALDAAAFMRVLVQVAGDENAQTIVHMLDESQSAG